ncbi:hypothetical protein F5148DRAFT_1149032 [Russula earlei]|uniref:Uncharacterized protein n=1 Tax=Russula earlei TaxID=71964 RepID=A0ACC0U9X1_9AGAM|nr:hypothetical protein F5148DRAFT_1149032 [Russula earlei]
MERPSLHAGMEAQDGRAPGRERSQATARRDETVRKKSSESHAGKKALEGAQVRIGPVENAASGRIAREVVGLELIRISDGVSVGVWLKYERCEANREDDSITQAMSKFTFSEREGMVLLAQTSTLSASAIIGLLSYIAYSAVTILRGARKRWKIGGAVEVLFLNQLAWDLAQAVGGIMNIKWALEGVQFPEASVMSRKDTDPTLRRHQARLWTWCSFVDSGRWSVLLSLALSNRSLKAIAVYTLYVLCFSGVPPVYENEDERRRKSLRRSLTFIACQWIAVGVVVAINIGVDGAYQIYGPTGYWCWIQPKYLVQRIAADYAFFWLTGASNIVIYSILFLYIKGYIATDGWRIYRLAVRRQMTSSLSSRRAYGLLYYPAVYIVSILPLSIARFRTFTNHSVPSGAIVFVDMMFLANGVFNVILFSLTRPFLLPHDLPSLDRSSDQDPVVGFQQKEDSNRDAVNNGPPSIPRINIRIDHNRQTDHSVGGRTLQSSRDEWPMIKEETPSETTLCFTHVLEDHCFDYRIFLRPLIDDRKFDEQTEKKHGVDTAVWLRAPVKCIECFDVGGSWSITLPLQGDEIPEATVGGYSEPISDAVSHCVFTYERGSDADQLEAMSQFTFGERVGLILLVQTSALSASAIVGLLSYIVYSAITILRGARKRWKIGGTTEVLFLNQLAWDMIQAVGGIMDIKCPQARFWTWCSFVDSGRWTVLFYLALSNQSFKAIAVYTLYVLCFSGGDQLTNENEDDRRRKSLRRSLAFTLCLWITVGLVVAINMGVDGAYHFYGPTGFWCWIASKYSIQRIAADYAFFWITAASNIVIYSILFLYIKGYIATNGWRIYRRPVRQEISDVSSKRAYGLLYYPAVYIVSILPLSIARFRAFTNHSVPHGATIFVDMMFLANGLFNVILFSFTRPFLLPHDLPSPNGSPQQDPIAEVQQKEGSNHDAADNGLPSIPHIDIPFDPYRQTVHSDGGSTLPSSGARRSAIKEEAPSEGSLGR